jgi:NAD(P)-dependent dehydrogenase (short-subunit alcohol dehydrogenase family)
MTIRFDNRVAIITGAGGGLGRSHALLLAARGAKVVVNDPGGSVDGKGGDNSAADKVVNEIKAAGGQAVASYDSVSTWAGAQNIINTAVKAFGGVDILVNNAGILRDKSFSKMPIEDFELVMQVHFMGTVYCTKAAWPIMNEKKYGRVVLTSSASGLAGNFGQSNYGAAKTAMLGFMNCLRHEGERNNIKVNSISPAADTRMTGNLMDATVIKFMKPEHVSTAVAWMCSEECNVTGQTIGAAGGYYTAIRLLRTEGVSFDPAHPASIEDFAAQTGKLFDFSKTEEFTGVSKPVQAMLKAKGYASQ